ncbi:MAG: MBG domain-containing protein [Anaeroplasmataceae bacterium]
MKSGKGGGAGIRLTDPNSLKVYGYGTIRAIGGNGGNGGDGTILGLYEIFYEKYMFEYNHEGAKKLQTSWPNGTGMDQMYNRIGFAFHTGHKTDRNRIRMYVRNSPITNGGGGAGSAGAAIGGYGIDGQTGYGDAFPTELQVDSYGEYSFKTAIDTPHNGQSYVRDIKSGVHYYESHIRQFAAKAMGTNQGPVYYYRTARRTSVNTEGVRMGEFEIYNEIKLELSAGREGAAGIQDNRMAVNSAYERGIWYDVAISRKIIYDTYYYPGGAGQSPTKSKDSKNYDVVQNIGGTNPGGAGGMSTGRMVNTYRGYKINGAPFSDFSKSDFQNAPPKYLKQDIKKSYSHESRFKNYSSYSSSKEKGDFFRYSVELNNTQQISLILPSTGDSFVEYDKKITGLTRGNNVTSYTSKSSETNSSAINDQLLNYKKPEIPGYIFKGYFLGPDINSIRVITEDLLPDPNYFFETSHRTFYAVFDKDEYYINYDSVDTTSDVTGETPKTITLFDSGFTLDINQYKKIGYEFVGWATSKTDALNGIVSYTDGYKLNMPPNSNPQTSNYNCNMEKGKFSKNVTVYAVWRQIITFDYNGASSPGGLSPIHVYWGGKLDNIVFQTPNYTGAVFDGWNTKPDATGSTVFDAKGKVSSNYSTWYNLSHDEHIVTLYAMWEVKTNLNFYKGTGSTNPDNLDKATVTIYSYIGGLFNSKSLIGESQFVPYVRKGYSLLGYNYTGKITDELVLSKIGTTSKKLENTGTAVKYNDLYTVFEAIDVQVKFDINQSYTFTQGGVTVTETYADGILNLKEATQEFDKTITAFEGNTHLIPILPGFKFLGFYDKDNVQYILSNGKAASGRIWRYVDSDDRTLYAKWEPITQNVNVAVVSDGVHLPNIIVRLVRKSSFQSNSRNTNYISYLMTDNGKTYTANVPRGEYLVMVNGIVYDEDFVIDIIDQPYELSADETKFQFFKLDLILDSDFSIAVSITINDVTSQYKRSASIWIYVQSKVHIQGPASSDSAKLSSYKDSVYSNANADLFVNGYEITQFVTNREIYANYSVTISSITMSLSKMIGGEKANLNRVIFGDGLVDLDDPKSPGSFYWSNEDTGIILKDEDAFQFGSRYSFTIRMKPTRENQFTENIEDVKITVLYDGEEQVFNVSENMYDPTSKIITFKFVAGIVEPIENDWANDVIVYDFEYDEQGLTFKQPQAIPLFGKVVIEYSNDKINYSKDIPVQSGVWYVRLTVEGTLEYTGLDVGPLEFTIYKKVLTYESYSGGIVTYNGQKHTSNLVDFKNISGESITTVDVIEQTNAGRYPLVIKLNETTNYALNSASNTENTLIVYFEIKKANLNITLNKISSIYGDEVSAPEYYINGFVPGDSISTVFDTSKFVFDTNFDYNNNNSVGIYYYNLIEYGDVLNYNVNISQSTLSVLSRKIKISAVSKDVIYGSEYTIDYNIENVAFGHTANDIFGNSQIINHISSNVGIHTLSINPNLYNSNYLIERQTGTLNIMPATVTITLRNSVIQYGTVTPEFKYDVTGLVNGETFNTLRVKGNNNTTIQSTIKINTTYNPLSLDYRSVGEYDVTIIGAEQATNYNIVYINSKLTVTKAILTISINNFAISYGEAIPNRFGYVASGFKFQEQVNNLNGTITFSTNFDINDPLKRRVGEYDLFASGISSNNYEIQIIEGKLIVTSRLLNIVGKTSPIQYGDTDLEIDFKFENHVFDDIDIIKENFEYYFQYFGVESSKIPVGKYPLLLSNTSHEVFDSYIINYQTSYVEVTKRVLQVVVEDQTITYGDKTPILTVNLENALPQDIATLMTGVRLSTAYNTSNEATRNSGVYSINVDKNYFLSVASNFATFNNYEYNTFVNGELTVLKKDILIETNAITKTYGYELSTEDFKPTSSGFAYPNDENMHINYIFSTTYDSSVIEKRKIGFYDVFVTSKDDLLNYNFTYKKTSIEIIKRDLSISIADIYIEYGEDLPTITPLIEGYYIADLPMIQSNIRINTKFNSSIQEFRGVGIYNLDLYYLDGNYNISFSHAKLHVEKSDLKIVVEDIKVKNGTTISQDQFKYDVLGLKFQDNESNINLDIIFETNYDVNSELIEFDIIVSANELSNYNLILVNGKIYVTLFTINIVVKDGQYVSGENELTIELGKMIDSRYLPKYKRLGYKSSGWYLDEEFKTPFNLLTPISKNYTLYGAWERTKDSIYGVVVNDLRSELNNVELFLLDNGNIISKTNADKDGYFSFEDLIEGRYYNIMIEFTAQGIQRTYTFASNVKTNSDAIRVVIDNKVINTKLNIQGGSDYSFVIDDMLNAFTEEDLNSSIQGKSIALTFNVKETGLTPDHNLVNYASLHKLDSIFYFDVSVSKEIGNGNKVKITKLDKNIKIVIKMKLDKGQDYFVYRDNNGYDVINTEVNENGEYLEIDIENNQLILNIQTLGVLGLTYNTQRSVMNTNWISVAVTLCVIIAALGVTVVTVKVVKIRKNRSL